MSDPHTPTPPAPSEPPKETDNVNQDHNGKQSADASASASGSRPLTRQTSPSSLKSNPAVRAAAAQNDNDNAHANANAGAGTATRTRRWPKFRRSRDRNAHDDASANENQNADVLDEKKATIKTAEGNVEVAVDGDSEDLNGKPASLADIFRFATKFELFINLVGLIAAAAAGTAQPLMTVVFGSLTKSFVDFASVLYSGNPAAIEQARANLHHNVNKDALLLVYIGIAMFAATYIYMATWVYTGEEVTRRIRERYLSSVLRQNIGFFDKLGAGEVATRISSDTNLIQEGISDKISISVMFIATFVAGFAVAYVRNWRLALAMTSMVPCIAVTGAVMNKFQSAYQQIELQHLAEASTLAEEAVSTVRTAKAFHIERRLVDLYDVSNIAALTQGVKKSIVQGMGLGAFFFVIYSGYALAFYFGAVLIAEHHADSGQVITVFFSILIGSFSMAMIAPNMQALAFAKAAGGKILHTIYRVPPIDSSSDQGLKPDRCDGEITVEDVDFAYPARPNVPILEKFSVAFPKGKVTALVGASGSGKSTIIGLVERFYDPDAGSVKLDGVDLRDLHLGWLRTQIGLVSQEPTLFATTIQGNIEHGLIGSEWEHAPAEKKAELVREAAKMANADGFISQLPDGYDTMVGERGFLLSGGQKQRVSIARAIVSNPRILLLDEATSALDTNSEQIVQDALDRASRGRTTITIAHRLSTIKAADKIVVMAKGKILEQGRHEELLMDPNGPYSHLVNAQKIRAATSSRLEDKAEEDEGDDTAGIIVETAEEEKARLREEAKAEMPAGLDRTGSKLSVASEIMRKKQQEEAERAAAVKPYGTFYLLYRLALINKDKLLSLYLPGLFASVCSGSVYPAFAILFGRALATFSITDAHVLKEQGARNALWFFVMAIVSTISIGIQMHNLVLGGSILCRRIRYQAFAAVLRADVSYHDDEKNSSGSLASSLSDWANKINGLVGVTLGTIVQSISTLVVGAIIALCYGWKLALIVIACIPVTISAGFVRLRVVVLKDQKIKKAHEDSAQLACEAAAAIRTVASLTRESDVLETYKRELKEPAKVSHNTAFISNFWYALSQATSFWVIAMAFWYGAGLIADLQYNTQQFFTVFTAVVFGSIQAGNVFSFVPDISNAKSAANDVIRLLDNQPEIDSDSPDGGQVPQVDGRIRFENVHFRYPTRPGVRVLRGLDLDIKPGSYVALVGGSGCGKSTTIQLVERFYDPVIGSVTIDGRNIADLNLVEYRKHIALVSQEPTLYAGDIEFNIRLGSTEPEKVTQEDLERACADANILTFIKSLPDGFKTQVGGRGTQLSGGQKQRIAIARALIRNPKILLLDEATSALDSESEKVVQDALDKAAKGRTTIAIAHRLSTISRADMIFVLKDGKVAEQGNHGELMSVEGGLYKQLVSLQELQNEEA